MKQICPIWKIAAGCHEIDGDRVWVESPRCGGSYMVSGSLFEIWENSIFSISQRVQLTELIRVERLSNEVPLLKSDSLQNLLEVNLTISERRDRVLEWTAKKSGRVGHVVEVFEASTSYLSKEKFLDSFEQLTSLFGLQELLGLSAECACKDTDETISLISICVDQGLMTRTTFTTKERRFRGVELTYSGWERVESLRAVASNSKQCFVAMWFSSTLNEVYENGFRRGILDAGYIPVRIDRKEHNNKIDDEIIAEIKRAKFVVADFTSEIVEREGSDGRVFKDTHARGGVYFEAGFAKGLGKEVIWCVSKEVIEAGVLHFDTRQFAHIVWKDADDLRLQLSRRISATLGDGPNKKPA
jgi:hypothetical protein